MPNSMVKLPRIIRLGGVMRIKNYSSLPAKRPRDWLRQTSPSIYSFDPSAYSIDIRMNSNIGAISQSNANTQQTNAMLRTAEGGVSSFVEVLGNLQQMLLNAANGTNSDSDRRDLGKMVDATIATLNDNAGIQYKLFIIKNKENCLCLNDGVPRD